MRRLVFIFSLVLFLGSVHSVRAVTDTCGVVSNISDGHTCSCTGAGGGNPLPDPTKWCCGWPDSTQADGCGDHSIVQCGGTYPANNLSYICGCSAAPTFTMSNGQKCCGWKAANGATDQCFSSYQQTSTGTNTGNGVTAETFDTLNIAIFGGTPDDALTTPRGIIGRLLPYLFTFGGLILFIMLIWGGFEMLTGAANPKSQEAGKQRMTAAVIGFILLFGSFWLAQLVQTIFGISIL